MSASLEYQDLLVRHLRDQEAFGMPRKKSGPSRGDEAALVIQAAWRGWRDRERFGRWRIAARRIQRCWRRLVSRRKAEKMWLAATVIQVSILKYMYLHLRSIRTAGYITHKPRVVGYIPF